MIRIVENLNLADAFVTFLALLGPQKVLVSLARMALTLDVRSIRRVAFAASVAAAAVGAACALAAPWIATFFHISDASLGLSAGVVFFVYALGLILGFHFDSAAGIGEATEAGEAGEAGEAAKAGGTGGSGRPGRGPRTIGVTVPTHPLSSGFREMLLPFVVSPLAVAAALQESLYAATWAGRWAVAGAYAAVALVNLVCAWLLAPLLRRINDTVLDVLSRLLGILLAAVGVQIFLNGLAALGIHGLGTH